MTRPPRQASPACPVTPSRRRLQRTSSVAAAWRSTVRVPSGSVRRTTTSPSAGMTEQPESAHDAATSHTAGVAGGEARPLGTTSGAPTGLSTAATGPSASSAVSATDVPVPGSSPASPPSSDPPSRAIATPATRIRATSTATPTRIGAAARRSERPGPRPGGGGSAEGAGPGGGGDGAPAAAAGRPGSWTGRTEVAGSMGAAGAAAAAAGPTTVGGSTGGAGRAAAPGGGGGAVAKGPDTVAASGSGSARAGRGPGGGGGGGTTLGGGGGGGVVVRAAPATVASSMPMGRDGAGATRVERAGVTGSPRSAWMAWSRATTSTASGGRSRGSGRSMSAIRSRRAAGTSGPSGGASDRSTRAMVAAGGSSRSPLKGLLRVEQGVEGGAQGPHVGRGTGPVPGEDLGRGERDRADQDAGGRVGALRQPGDAEVAQLGRAVGIEEDVGGLDVPVEDAGLVGGGQGVGHVDADVEDLGPRQRALAVHAVVERAAGQVLHDQVRVAGVGGAGVVHGDHRGVARQPPDGAALGEEATLAARSPPASRPAA